MPLWGSIDQANNSALYAPMQVNKPANTANRDALFGNTTASAFVNNVTIGQYGVSAAEVAVTNGSVISIGVVDPGYGYFANATVTLSGNATANATANSTGFISVINITAAGNNYLTPPTVTISAPTISFNGNTDVVEGASNNFITLANGTRLQNGMAVRYVVAAGNTAIGGLVSNGNYFITGANTTGVKLAATANGAAITLTKTVTEAGHSLVGKTATGDAVISGGKGTGITHAGWVLRTEGTGGRAGRVNHEVLVAMGSMTGDATDDTILPDA